MTPERGLPAEWTLESERTTHDELMGREYTTVLYRQEHTGGAVYINEVVDGENVWRYSVHHSGRDGDIGVADDLEAAKELALAFMNESAASA
jgi:hypothetical protein